MAYTKFFPCMGVAVMLAACGDDSGSTNAVVIDNTFEESVSDVVVATIDALPKCTDKRDSTMAYVKDKKLIYVCSDGRWVLDDEGKSSSSSGKAKSSSSSGKAKSSSSGEGTSSAKETSSSSSENGPASSANDTIAVVKFKDETISGVAQKGPFLAQSEVKLYELDQKTLAKTGKVFLGEITKNDGKFKLSSVTLSGPYARLEVSGKYRDERGGGTASKKITLQALVNLVDHKKVNVNVLTHFVYERTLYLYEKGVGLAAAKKQAETEFFGEFDIQGETASSESLDIFGNDDESAMLLALSVLMLGGNETSLTDVLDKVAADFKKDGKWDSESMKAKKADWAQTVDTQDGYSKIRSNVKDWNLGDAPNFEKYLRAFWYGVYGFGNCGGKDAVTQNKKSSLYGSETHFVCRNGVWSKLTGVEGKCGVCTADRENSFCNSSASQLDWKVCQNGQWHYTDRATVDTYGWTAGNDGNLRKGDSTDTFYKYDEVLNGWGYVESNDITLELNGCTFKREGEVGLSPKDNTYYVCKYSKDYDTGVAWHDWKKAQEIDFIKRDEKCESEDVGRIVAGIDTVTNKYYCSTEGWVDLRKWSFSIPKEFRFNPDIDYGTMTDNRDGKTYRTVEIGDQVWMAENLNYAGNGIGFCYDDVPANCEAGGRLYKWDAAKTVCPEGWHLPSKTEFDTLLSAVKQGYGEEQCSLASMLKATSGWNYGGQGCDKTGFSAVPAGGRHVESYRAPEYNFAGSAAFFLTSTEQSADEVYIMQLNLAVFSDDYYESYEYGVSLVYDYKLTQLDGWPHYNTKESEFSVRCLKDAE